MIGNNLFEIEVNLLCVAAGCCDTAEREGGRERESLCDVARHALRVHVTGSVCMSMQCQNWTAESKLMELYILQP
jgi:hypothetical protein